MNSRNILANLMLALLLTLTAVAGFHQHFTPTTTANTPNDALQTIQDTQNLSYHMVQKNDGYEAINPAHNLAIEFFEHTIEIGSEGESWQLYSQDIPLEMTAAENRLTYHYEHHATWYVNGRSGLQQGFTLFEPAVIQFEVGGTLHTRLDDDRLLLVDDNATTVLTYSGLMAWDAHHMVVPVTMSLDDGRLVFAVDDSIATYPITIDPWIEQQKIVPVDVADRDYFGYDVALDGNTALIGAPEDDDNGSSSGSAYVYTFTGVSWEQQAKLGASDGTSGDELGRSVALDGDTALVAAVDADGGAAQSGAVYVFMRSGSSWTQQAKLIATDALGDNDFGYSVVLAGDMAIIGDRYDDQNGADSGSIYIFTRSGTTWSQQQKIAGPDGAGGRFGSAVSLHGNKLVVGAPFAKGAYLYTLNGAAWVFQQKLVPKDPGTLDWYGTSVEVVDDTIMVAGELLVGQQRSTVTNYWVYVFERAGSNWFQADKILNPSGTQRDDAFGHGIEIVGDLAIITAAGPFLANAPGNGGRVYVYKNLHSGGWTQVDMLQASDTGPYNFYGSGVAFDGARVLIGAPTQDNVGAAYVLDAQFTVPVVTAACNGPDLQVIITDLDGPFDITARAGMNLPLLGVASGTHTINGPEKWDDVTVAKTSDYLAWINLGQFKCRTDERPLLLNPPHRAHLINLFPVFGWTPISDANDYRIFLFDDRVAAQRTVDIRENSGGATQMTLSQKLFPGRYFWRVRGRQNRVWSLWSVRRTLFIEPTNTFIQQTQVPPRAAAPPNVREPAGVLITPTLPPPPNTR